MGRLTTLLKKDARVVLRSRLLLVVLVVYPLLIVGVLGYAFSEPNQKIPLAIVNNDVDANGNPSSATIQDPFSGQNLTGSTLTSQEIVDSLDELPLTDVRVIQDADEGRRLLLTGQVQAVVILPPGFIENVVSFRDSATLSVVVDQSDPVRAAIMETSIRGFVQEFQEAIVQEKVDIVVTALEESLRTNLPPDHFVYPGFDPGIQRLVNIRQSGNLSADQEAQIEVVIKFLQNLKIGVISSIDVVKSVAQPVIVDIDQEESGSLFIRDLVVPAALGLSIYWTGSLATAALLVYERESAAFQRLGVTPTTRWQIVGSKVILTGTVVFIQAALILLAALALFGTRVDNILLTFVLILLSSLASIGIGLFLSGITRDVNGAVLLSVLVTFPMLFLAGLFFPVDFMPRGAQLLAGAFPLTYTVSGLRGSMLRGFVFGDAITHMAALLLAGLVLGLAGYLLGRRLERLG